MGLSDILGTLKDKPKFSNDISSMKMSKQLLGFTKSSSQSFNKLIKIQEKSPIQKRQLSTQQEISQKTTQMSMKIDSLTKLTQVQTQLLQQNQRHLIISNKYLESLDKGLKLDRQQRQALEDEERRYRRRTVSRATVGNTLSTKPEKKDGLFNSLLKLLGLGGAGLLGGGGFLEGLATMFLGGKAVKGIKGVFGFVGGLVNSVRGFLFGTKIVENAEGVNRVVTKTGGIFSRLISTGKSISTFLLNTGSVISSIAKSTGKFLKLPELMNIIKNSSFITKVKGIVDVSKTTGVGAKVASVGSKALGVGKSVYNTGKMAFDFAKPALGLAGKMGSQALGLGGKALSGLGNFLAPTAKVGTKVGGTLLGKVLPGVGAVLSAGTAISDFQKGDYLGTVINGLAAVTNFMGPLGMLTSGMLTVVDMVRKGEITGVFNTVTDGLKSVVNFVTDTFNPMKFIDGIKKWWGSTWLGKKLLGSEPTTQPDSSGSSGGIFDKAKSYFGFGNSSTPTTTTLSGMPVPTSSLAEKTFSALYSNEASESQKAKISHAIRGNSNFTFGRSQFDIGQRPDAWKSIGYSDNEISKLRDIGSRARKLGSVSKLGSEDKSYLVEMQKKMYNKSDIINQLDMQQQVNLSNKAKAMVTHLGNQGFTFSSPSAIAQFADIYNQFGSMDKNKVPALLEKFSGGKLITPESILQYRLYRENNTDQRRRFKNIESQFSGESGQNLSSNQLIGKFNSSGGSSPSLNTSKGIGSSFSSSSSSGSSGSSSSVMSQSESMSTPPKLSPIEGDMDLSSSKSKEKGKPESKTNKSMIGKLPIQGVITSRFGNRIHPIFGTKKFHGGLDIGAGVGTPIYSPYPGKVMSTFFHEGGGNTTLINHGGGLVTKYLHQSKFLVEKGQQVQAGQEIGKVGSTGSWTTGPHLHFVTQVNGKPVDPEKVLGGNLKVDVGTGNTPKEKDTVSASNAPKGLVGIASTALDFIAGTGKESYSAPVIDSASTTNLPDSMQNKDYNSSAMSGLTTDINKQLSTAIFGTNVASDSMSGLAKLLPSEGDSDLSTSSKKIISSQLKSKDMDKVVSSLLPNMSSTSSSSSGQKQTSATTSAGDIFKGVSKMGLTALGVPEAGALLDFLPNPIDILENVWNMGSALFSGDPKKIEQAMNNRKKSGLDNLLEGVITGKKGMGDVVNATTQVASGLGLSGLGSDVTNILSQTTGMDVAGMSNKIGSLTEGFNIKSLLDSDTSSPLLDTKALDLSQQQAIAKKQSQEQIKASLSSLDSVTQKSMAQSSQTINSPQPVKERASLLSYADIGTAQIQSNTWG